MLRKITTLYCLLFFFSVFFPYLTIIIFYFHNVSISNRQWPGDWCAGGSINVLRGKDEESPELIQFRQVLDADEHASSLSTDVLLEKIREIEELIPPTPKKKGCGKFVMGKILAYGRWWVQKASSLSGYRETKEYGSMPKTKN